MDRFWAKVAIGEPDECWEWTASRRGYGYGQFYVGRDEHGKSVISPAHRVAWELTHGPIPLGDGHHGTCVLHTCDNPPCCNPDHLWLGTVADNWADCLAKGRANLIRGERHPRARLNAEAVSEIRACAPAGRFLRGERSRLAERFGVSGQTLHMVATGQLWKVA